MNSEEQVVIIQSRGWRFHPWLFPRIFTILLLPALLFLALVGPLRSSPFVEATLVLPALGVIWLSFYVGLELVALRRVEIAPGGVRFIYPLRTVYAAWNALRPAQSMPRLNSYDFEVEVLGVSSGSRKLYPAVTEEQHKAIVSYPSGQSWSRPVP